MVMMTTASALRQCVARSQIGCMVWIAVLMPSPPQVSGTGARPRAQRLQHAAGVFILHECDYIELRRIPSGRQGDVALHADRASPQPHRPDPGAHNMIVH